MDRYFDTNNLFNESKRSFVHILSQTFDSSNTYIYIFNLDFN